MLRGIQQSSFKMNYANDHDNRFIGANFIEEILIMHLLAYTILQVNQVDPSIEAFAAVPASNKM
jgi:hypothetical protein